VDFKVNRSHAVSLTGAVFLLMSLFAAFLVPGSSIDSDREPPAPVDLTNSQGTFDRIACEATLMALARQVAQAKEVECGAAAFCLHPDTRPEDAERILRELPTYAPAAGLLGFWKRYRWDSTATDGSTGSAGDPITITWSVVPDGTWADGGASDLVAVFTAAWGGDGWMTIIRDAFDRWGAVTGVTYVEVADDGADMPNNPGVLGVRGDVRIGGRWIDGPSNVLAYDYYPDLGDMVLDTGDIDFYTDPTAGYANLLNVVMHEHGHGLGLGHVLPEDCTKLMEAYVCDPTAFIGAQDDDIRGGMRNYGDPYENNDNNTEPADLGTVTDTLLVENLSIDNGNTDVDWYLVTLTNTSITVEVDPIGSTYLLGRPGTATNPVSTDSVCDPDIDLYDATGTTLLASATYGGRGDTEVLHSAVPSAGAYQVRVYAKAGTGSGVQRYTMMVHSDPYAGVPFANPGSLPRTGLGLTVSPNPSSTAATAAFTAAGAGPYTVEVFDVTGRPVRVIDGRSVGPGGVEVVWDGRDGDGRQAASGIYFLRVGSGGRVEVKQALLVR
jgi:hypothetical protein